MGAEILIIKGASFKPGFDYEPANRINVKGISNALLRTTGKTTLKLLTPTHETTQIFHVTGDSFDCPYDGILGQDFWKSKRATINCCDRKITMGEVTINFDDETNRGVRETPQLTLKARTENILQLPTKREIVPGVYLAESLTREVNGYCIMSIVNTLGEDIATDFPHVELEEIEHDYNDTVLLFSNSVVEDGSRLSKLHDELRTDHLNSEERASLVKI
jgi:hypothetical protein